MRLIVDNDPRRIRLFQEAFGSGVRTASNFQSALATLRLVQDGDLTKIHLDHDGVEGEWLAMRIATLGLHPSARYYIHSSNYVGAVKMRDILSQAGYDVEMVSFEELVT